MISWYGVFNTICAIFALVLGIGLDVQSEVKIILVVFFIMFSYTSCKDAVKKGIGE